ncbi:MAG: response regulator transcription factor [Candidatus Sumerlaeota bacterium]|nr:response regulator transcription factor [Candidatus Sumerlaeota bacterium]
MAAKNGKEETRVLIVDDHPVVRYGLAQLIDGQKDLAVCGQASGISEAIRVVQDSKPHLAIIDISLQGANGIELIKQIKALDKSVKMLVWSMHDESLFAERALHAGALGYLNKKEAAETILEAIRQVLAGKVYLSPRMTERVMQRLMQGKPADGLPTDALSDREMEVFELIGRGMATREIAESLHLSPKTIEAHRDNVKKKLGAETNAELVRRAVQWVLQDSQET